jgi:hypothetical protein
MTWTHLNAGGNQPGNPACGQTPNEPYTVVEEIHYVNCAACKTLFHKVTEAARASRRVAVALGEAEAMACTRLRLEQVEDLIEKARDDLRLHVGAALAPEEVSKLFDTLEQSVYSLLRYLQEFQP